MKNIQRPPEPLSILCENCHERFILEGNAISQEIEPSVVLHLLKCPHCQKVVPMWFETEVIVQARQELKTAEKMHDFLKSELAWKMYQRQKLKFQRIFNLEQDHWKLQTAGRVFEGKKGINQ